MTDLTKIDRLPPQAIEAEEGVIGAMLYDPSVIDDVFALMVPNDLWRDNHRIVADAIRDMRATGQTVDLVTVCDELERRGLLARIGGFTALSELINKIAYSSNAKYHAVIVREKSIARQLLEIGREIQERSYAGNLTAAQLIEQAERDLLSVSRTDRPGDLKALADSADSELARIDRRREGVVMGISTGFPDLDDMLDGFSPTQLIVVAARPGQGKSSLALNFAERCALDYGRGCLFVSQEMSDGELAGRSLASRSSIDHSKIRNGFLTPNEIAALHRTAADFRDAGRFWIDDTPGRTVSQIGSMARRLITREDLGAIFVDYIQLLKSDGNQRESRQEQVARISRDLKGLAMELRVPVIALSQLNRNLENREDRRPRISDIRESGGIEADANVIIMLHQPDEATNEVEAIVGKNRSGPTGIVRLTFLKHLMRFESFTPEPEYFPPDDDPRFN